MSLENIEPVKFAEPPRKGLFNEIAAVAKSVVKSVKSEPRVNYVWKYNVDKLQPNNQTRPERFPKILDAAKSLYPDAKRVLSFGCSTGEEIQSLAKRFPKAELVGVDIDHYAIERARKANKLPNAYFHDDLGALGKFDVITCFMVLFCLEVPVPKDRWIKTLKKLDAYCNHGGIIMIYTSDYDPMEVLGDAYEPINVWMREHNKKAGSSYYNGYYRKKPAITIKTNAFFRDLNYAVHDLFRTPLVIPPEEVEIELAEADLFDVEPIVKDKPAEHKPVETKVVDTIQEERAYDNSPWW